MLPLVSTTVIIMPYLVGAGIFTFCMFIGYLFVPPVRKDLDRLFKRK